MKLVRARIWASNGVSSVYILACAMPMLIYYIIVDLWLAFIVSNRK